MRHFIIRGHPEGSLGKVGCAQSRSIEQLGALDHSTRSIGHQLQEEIVGCRTTRHTNPRGPGLPSEGHRRLSATPCLSLIHISSPRD